MFGDAGIEPMQGTELENVYPESHTVRIKYRDMPSTNILLFYMSKLKVI